MPNQIDKPKPSINIDYTIEVILARRWLLIAPFCLVMVIGSVLAVKLPKIYQAETLILIQPQRVPEDYVRSVVTDDVAARINTLSQQINSRTNLEKIIKRFNLYNSNDGNEMLMEDKVAGIRRAIQVNVRRGPRREPSTFTISYQGRDPEKVMHVANALATSIIDENLKVREQQAIGTSIFLDSELTTMRVKLEALEVQLKNYRETYIGELPEQLDSNLRILDRLQDQLSDKQEDLRNAKNTMASLQQQITDQRRLLRSGGSSGDQNAAGNETDDLTRLIQMKQELEEKHTRYTAKHPDIIRLKSRIADLEQKIQNDAARDRTSDGMSALEARNPTLRALFQQKNDTGREIAKLNDEVGAVQREIDAYQNRVEATPKREQELQSLRRDYQNISDIYNSLLNRKLEAEISVNMEKKQKGEQFRIIDNAQIPTKPIRPNMRILFLMTVAVGVGFGGGIVFLLEYLNPSFKEPDEIESFLGVSVLATIPTVLHQRDLRMQKLNNVASLVSLGMSFVLLVSFSALVFVGDKKMLSLFESVF